MFRPASGDGPGAFTCVPSVQTKLDAAFAAKTLTPVNGVLVEAENHTIPGVLAACHIIAERQVFVEEIPDEANEWFALRRAEATRPDADAPVLVKGNLLDRFTKRKKTAEA